MRVEIDWECRLSEAYLIRETFPKLTHGVKDVTLLSERQILDFSRNR